MPDGMININMHTINVIPFIKSIILDDVYDLRTSWGLMEDFPDTCYLEIFSEYVKEQIVDDLHDKGGHIQDFAECCASFHSKESAEILLSGYKIIINEYSPWARNVVYSRANVVSGAFRSHGSEETRYLIKDFAKWPEYYGRYEDEGRFGYPKEFSICDTAQHGSYYKNPYYKNQGTKARAPYYWYGP